MERLIGLSDFPILSIVGAGIVIYLLVQGFKGKGNGGGNNNNSSSGNNTPPTPPT